MTVIDGPSSSLIVPVHPAESPARAAGFSRSPQENALDTQPAPSSIAPDDRSTADVLLQPYRLNDTFTLANRVVMAPMTRSFADDDLVPTEAMARYYARRADVGLIISEATIVRPDGQGYPNTPGLFTAAQVEGWRRVTAAVHERGGLIFAQLWHVGRVSHPCYLNGDVPVAPSAVPLSGRVPRTDGLHYGRPRALERDELPGLVAAFADAAEAALRGGFDGVEIHGANGYLLDQFLHAHTNRRSDDYGAAAADRARFPLEVIDAVIERIGGDRTGLRLSPGAYMNMEAHESDGLTFRQLLGELARRHVAWVQTGVFDDSTRFETLGGTAGEFLRQHWNGTLIGNGSYSPSKAANALSAGAMDLISIGRPLIANPDLVQKIARSEALLPYEAAMLTTLD